MTKHICYTLIAAFALVIPGRAAAQGSADLGQASLEQLMDIRVTSAARKSQRLEDVTAAVYVLTRQDILRSGLTSLPEILRLVPGVQVAQVNANKWAVSIRGFNDLYSNKLLVLVDGRSVYTRGFSGVFWDAQDVMISNIERIEVVRGPGGSVWGANAVNGVINIITRPAEETQGLLADVSSGSFERARAGLRYGGTLGSAAYRVFSEWTRYADAAVLSTPLADHWYASTTGFRTDWARGADSFMAQGHLTANRTRAGWLEVGSLALGSAPITDGVSDARDTSLLGRWTRTGTDGTVIQVQAYHSTTRREEPIVTYFERSSDVDAQYETRIGSRHGLVAGGGYRHVRLGTDDTLTTQLGSHRMDTFNAFVQDEIVLHPALALTVGAKAEHDTLGGWGILPSARLMWDASSTQRVWAAVSRARRTPSATDRFVRILFGTMPGPGLPIVIGFQGNPAYRSEDFLQAEAGYRVRLGSAAALDVTAFSGSYDGLSTNEPLEPVVNLTSNPAHIFASATFGNLRHVRTSGLEVSGHWTPVRAWQLDASYSFLDMATRLDPASLALDPNTDGNAPAHQWQLRSAVSLGPVTLNTSVFRVGQLLQLAVPAYTRVDAGAEFRLNSRLTVTATGQNLTNRQHQEFASDRVFLTTRMPRAAKIDLRWNF
jgi:iron complex outermembrane receptor protein